MQTALAQIGRILLVLALTSFLGVLMIRFAPGYDTDESDTDIRLSAETRAARRAARADDRNAFYFYLHHAQRLLKGDLGESRSLGRPVSSLLKERLPVTLRYAGVGLVCAWALSFLLALSAVYPVARPLDQLASGAIGLLLCLPTALVALFLFLLGGPPAIAITLVLLPQCFFYLRSEFRRASRAPHLLLARAKGLSQWRILVWHLMPSVVPPIAALAGLSVTLAFSAAVPIESFGDVPGIGQLTWQAALSRDLPLLTSLLLILTAVTLIANGLADGVVRWWTGSGAQ